MGFDEIDTRLCAAQNARARGLQVLLELRCNFFWRDHWAKTGDYFAFTIHQKLLEIPGNCVGVFVARLLGAQPLVQISRVVTVDIDLGKDREISVVFRCSEFQDLGICTRLLCPKLIARKGENVETVGGVIFLKRTQTCVLTRKASSAGDIDNEGNLTAILL